MNKRTLNEINRVESLVKYLDEVQHKNLEEALREVTRDIIKAETQEDKKNPAIIELNKLFSEIKEEIPEMIRTEKRMIFPHIRLIIENPEGKNSERDFHNLSTPVRNLIIKHHEALDKIQKLLNMVTALGYSGYSGSEYLKTYIALFNFYSFYEKQVYMEENILFPSVVNVFEYIKE